MPLITVPGHGTFEAAQGERLVNAIENAGVEIGHRCGGYARCTTCRVKVIAGEPPVITRAERDKLEDRKLLGEVRLACQMVIEDDMTIEPLMLVRAMGWSDPGPPPEDVVTPTPEWMDLNSPA